MRNLGYDTTAKKHVTASNVQTQGQTYGFIYTYDLAGDLIQENYPSGRVLKTTYDMAQRPTTTSGTASGTTTNYVQAVQYYPHGATYTLQYASNMWWCQNFSKNLQPVEAWSAASNNGSNWMMYTSHGFNNNETVSSQNLGYSPNAGPTVKNVAGNPTSTGTSWNGMTFLNTQYTYDNLNRITKATDSSYLRYFMFDEFGNMSVTGNANIPLSGLTPTNVNGNGPVAYNTNNNHMVAGSVSYDARGNITALGGTGSVTLAFDAENNLKSETDSGTTFNWIYDAEGQRAQKQISGGATTVYVHDAFGNLAAEYTTSPGVTPACTTCYLSYDVMGSVKMVTDQQQFLVARHDYIPYGEAIPDGTANRTGDFEATSNVMQGFTSQESDGGTASMDFFNARHLSAAVGSFVQLDPMNAGASLTNPQSWNGYGYVLGNPLGLVDPSGACDVLINGVNQAPGWAPIDDFATNMINAFPYADTGLIGGALSVLGSDPGVKTAYVAIQSALSQTPSGQQANVFTISGGAQSFASAYALLSPSEQARIGNVTYMIPGSNAAALPNGTGTTSVIDDWAGFGIPAGRPKKPFNKYFANKSLHQPSNVLSQFSSLLSSLKGSTCPTPQKVLPGKKGSVKVTSSISYGSGGGGSFFGGGGSWWWWTPPTSTGTSDPPVVVRFNPVQ